MFYEVLDSGFLSGNISFGEDLFENSIEIGDFLVNPTSYKWNFSEKKLEYLFPGKETISYQLDDNNFLKGGYAFVGGYPNEVVLDIETFSPGMIDRNLFWDVSERKFIRKKNESFFNERLEKLRKQRDVECFSVVNRGSLWYESLSSLEKEELKRWYKEWLDITDNVSWEDDDFKLPEKPEWLK